MRSRPISITTPRLLISQFCSSSKSQHSHFDFLSHLLSQDHVKGSLFSVASEALLSSRMTKNGWDAESCKEFVDFWMTEKEKGFGCGLFLIHHKEKENVKHSVSQDDTFPPRKILKNSSSSFARSANTVNANRQTGCLDSRPSE